MIKSNLRWAVGVTLAGDGDDESVLSELKRIDPLLRRGARRALQNEVMAILDAHPDAELGRPMLEEVGQRIGAQSIEENRRPPFWSLSTALVVFALTLASLVVYKVLTRPGEFSPDDIEEIPQSQDAYKTGGRPISLGEAGDKLFGESIVEFIIALDRDSRKPSDGTKSRLAEAEKALLSAENKALIGDAPFTALSNLVESCKATLIDGESVTGDVDELNDALMAAGLAYHFGDGRLRHGRGTTPLIYSYLVEKVRLFDIPNSGSERVLWLRRIDNVNYRTNMIGSTHRGASVAVLRRDLIDEQVHERLLPALAKDANYELWPVKHNRKAPEIKARLESTSGEKVRQEFAAAGAKSSAGAKLANLLKRRDERFETLKTRASANRIRVRLPRGYRFDMTPYKPLAKHVGNCVIRDLENIDEELASPEMAAVYKTVRSAYVESIEFHELQHRMDYRAGPHIPEVLQRYLKPHIEGEELSRFGRRLVTEYSAALAEIANSKIPLTALIRISRYAFDRAGWSTTYAETAVGVIEILCKSLDISYSPFVDRREVDRVALATAFLQILDKSSQEVQAAARKGWSESFGRDYVTPTLRR